MKQRHHVAVVGLGFGDEGKGGIVDWLCATRPVRAVIRFNGGAQAGHNVLTEFGKHHTFSQWGSGTLRGVPTYLSEHMIIEPFSMINEAMHLKELRLVDDPWALLHIDKSALVATPYHRAVGRARELARGADRHGSVGMGIGEAVSQSLSNEWCALRFHDLLGSEMVLKDRLEMQRAWAEKELNALGWFPEPDDGIDLPDPATIATTYSWVASRVTPVYAKDWENLLNEENPCIFEGAQGVLLDERYGFHPYTTWSDTTFSNALKMAGPDLYRLGVVRSYTTRHGPGPFPTEDDALMMMLREEHNDTGKWQGEFRVGNFDAVAHRYAIRVCGGVDSVAVTHVDRGRVASVCSSYWFENLSIGDIHPGADLVEQEKLTQGLMDVEPALTPFGPDVVGQIREELGVSVVVKSTGAAANEKWGDVPWAR